MIIPYLGIWQTVIVQPISWLLLVLYNFTSNYGLAIILFTLITKIILLPFSAKSKKGMMAMQRFNPKLKELEAKYKNDKEKYNQELQKLYQQEKVNPLSGCIWALIPWPIFIALYSAIRMPLDNLMRLTSEQVSQIIQLPVITEFLTSNNIDVATAAANNQIVVANAIHQHFGEVTAALPELAHTLVDVNFNFLGMNLSLTPVFNVVNVYWFLPIISGAVMYLSTKLMQKLQGGDSSAADNQTARMMTFMGPAMSVWIGYMWPSAMCLYWIANSLFGMVQDTLLTFYYRKKFAEQDAIKAEKEAAEREALRQKKAAQAARRLENDKRNRSKTSKNYNKLKGQIESSNPKPEDAPEEDTKEGSNNNDE